MPAAQINVLSGHPRSALQAAVKGVAAAMVAFSVAAAAEALFHGSYDWFWQYPGVMAPGFFLLGAAAAPAVAAARWRREPLAR